jgi:TPR repeat protein
MALFRKAADQQNGEAEASLGFMYAQGLGAARDEATAMSWYRKSSAVGGRTGAFGVARLYAEGRGAPRDLGQARVWMRKAAERGNADALNWLDYNAPGAEKQPWRAARTRAAEQRMRAEIGDPTATFDHEQLTGDDKTGQTCGQMRTTSGLRFRFIVYLDVAEPDVEGGLGRKALTPDQFDDAWTNDCLGEGYDVR